MEPAGEPCDSLPEPYRAACRRMLAEVRRDYAETGAETGLSEIDPRVALALTAVPRHRFLPEDDAAFAYRNAPQPIGHGQTISQPFIVALMTQLLAVGPDADVLEVGTGSGYQTAVLSRLVRRVHTIEIIPALAVAAAGRLREFGYLNVEARQGDGYHGWPEHAPYDGIIVTAAAPEVPPPLVEQLAPGARLVIPVGSVFGGQNLLVVERPQEGETIRRPVLPVAFVPLTRHS